jgi:glycosyltransferase involved in cell wall biosynthesis
MSGFGIENRVTELIRNFPSNIKKQIICLRKERPAPRGISVIHMPNIIHRSTAYKPLHFSIFSKTIRNTYFRFFLRNSDVVDAQFFPMTALPKTSKFIITWHSVTFPEFAPNYRESLIWNKEYKTMLNNMYHADMVIPVSKWTEKEIKDFDSSIPTKIIPNGVDLNKFRFKPLEKREKTILAVGRFTPHKGHSDAIMIFKEVLSELKDFNIKLLLVGAMHDQEYLEKLKKYADSIGIKKMDITSAVSKNYDCDKEKALELIKDSKNLQIPSLEASIEYMTNVHDVHMPYIYPLGDVFISCSHWEGFGMPMLEAQACGLPALGYNICSHPEVVANRDFLADENDIWHIAENVKKLLTDEKFYEKSCIEARKFAEQFSWKGVAKEYLSMINGL